MANYSSLIRVINNNIKANGNQEITGPVLNAVLQAIVSGLSEGALFVGIADTTTNPPAYDGNVFYVAIEPGTYSNFGVIVPNGSIGIIYNTSSDWAVKLINTYYEIDVDTLMQDSPSSDDINEAVGSFSYLKRAITVGVPFFGRGASGGNSTVAIAQVKQLGENEVRVVMLNTGTVDGSNEPVPIIKKITSSAGQLSLSTEAPTSFIGPLSSLNTNEKGSVVGAINEVAQTLLQVAGQMKAKQDKTDESLQTTDKTVTGAINELQKALGLDNVTRVNIEVEEANAYINYLGIKETSSSNDLSKPIALKAGQVLYGKTYSYNFIAVLSESTDVDNRYNVIKSGFEVGNGIMPLCYIATKDIEVILTKNKSNEPELYIADINLTSGLLRKGGQDVGFEDFKNNKFIRTVDRNGEWIDDYEDGLLDCFIDTELYPNAAINNIQMWCYDTVFYISDFVDTNNNNVIFSKPFAGINNYEPVDIIVDEKKIGYVVFSDKQKFLDHSSGNGPSLNKFWANRPHEYVWIYYILSKLSKSILTKPVKLQDTNFSVKEAIGNNLCNPETLTKGSFYINNETGNVGSGFGYGYTDYIPIGKDGLTITNGYVSGKVIGHAVYNADKQFIRGYRTDTIDYQEGDAYVRFSIGSNTESVMVSRGQTALPFETFKGEKEVISENVLPNTVINPIKTYDPIEISLPDKIYAVVGDTLQLFYRGMIQAVDPYRYNILISCTKGKQYPRYFEYTPTTNDVGTVDFTITIKDDNRNVLSTKTCQLVTVDIVKSPASNLKVMCFGDSLTAAGTWCREADRRLTEAGGTPAGKELTNIDFVGSKKNGTTGYFGVGGWTWNSYTTRGRLAYRFQVTGVNSLSLESVYTGNGNTFTIREINVTEGTGNILCVVDSLTPAPAASGTLTKTSGNGDEIITYTSVAEDAQNPLWDTDADKMTFIPYANEVSEGQIDVVYTLLTWNGHTAGRTDFSSMLTQMKVFADTLHAEFPNAKLKIMGVQVPSVRGGMGANYGATGSGYADGYGMVVTALNMNKFYQEFANDEEYSSFVEFVNVSSQFDTEYMMPHNEKVVNTRSTVKEWMDTNGVHPSNEGYLQIGDVVYRNFIANFCQ